MDLFDSIQYYDSQIKAEINACKYVVVTDGFTWLFLTKDKNGEIIKAYRSVSLLRKGKHNRKIYEASKKTNKKLVNMKILGKEKGNRIIRISVNPPEWKEIPKTIKRLLEELITE